MANKTKAPQEIMTEEYKNSFMEVLGKAQKIGFELTVCDGKFVFQSFDGGDSYSLKLPIEMAKEFDYCSYWAMVELKEIFEKAEKAEAEKQRKQQIREIALAKLTEEEKEILFSH